MIKADKEAGRKIMESIAPLAHATPPDEEAMVFAVTMAPSDASKTAVTLICASVTLQILACRACTLFLSPDMQKAPLSTNEWHETMRSLADAIAKAERLQPMLEEAITDMQSAATADEQERRMERHVAELLNPFLQSYNGFIARGKYIQQQLLEAVNCKFTAHLHNEMGRLKAMYPVDWQSFCLPPRRDLVRMRVECFCNQQHKDIKGQAPSSCSSAYGPITYNQ